MIARALSKRFNIFFVILFICPNESQNQPGHHPSFKSAGFGVADNVLRDVNKPQFASARSDRDERPSSGFNLTDEEIKKFKIWEKGLVPFYIDTLSFSDKVLRDRIRWFLNEVNSLTPLNFIELPSPPKDVKTRWVFFLNRQGQLGCADLPIKNFTNEGVQRVVLGYDCINSGAGLAETVLAIVGIPPQHNAPDRDKFIKIINNNIIPEKKYLFEKLVNKEWLFHDLRYDFYSAGHYHHHKHSANGQATIKAKNAHGGITMGDQQGFSPSDIVKMLLIYNYIVKKNKDNLPACSKLFSRGKNYNKISLLLVEEMKPIPKPIQYFGGKELNEEASNGETTLEASSGETSLKASSGETPLEASSFSSKALNNSLDLSDTSDGNSLKNSESAEGNRKRKYSIPGRNNVPEKSSKLKSYQDPLSYLSDYQTGDESLQRSVWRKNRDYYNFGKVGAYFKSV